MSPSSVPCRILAAALAVVTVLCVPVPSLALLTKAEEREIGRKVLDEVHKEFRILEDPYVTSYLERVGRKLAAAANVQSFEPDFHVVADSRVNAFAVPGGHVFVTSQTLLLCGDESELAGVVAHELGHVDGRHIAYRLEDSSRLNLAALAAVLAGAFLARSAQAGAAIASFALAGAETKMLQYSRADEEDADRRALRTLDASAYDGWGLVRFMDTIRKQSPTPEGVPAYLFTHPLPENRAAYLAASLGSARPVSPKTEEIAALRRVQARILAEDPRPWGLALLEKRAADEPENAGALIGLAVVLKGAGRYGDAARAAARARALAPDDPEILHETASIQVLQGRATEGMELLESLRSRGGATEPVLRDLGWNYLETEQGEKALAVYDELAQRAAGTKGWEKLDYYRGLALGKAGREGEAHASLGRYYQRAGAFEVAQRHYREAVRLLPPGRERDEAEQAVKNSERER